jgi:hypothetical protein
VPAVCTFTAWDSGNGNRFILTGQQVLLVRNAHATLARTVTVLSAPDPYGRSGDITAFNLAALAIVVCPQFQLAGWQQADGYVYVDGSTIDIQFCVLTLVP